MAASFMRPRKASGHLRDWHFGRWISAASIEAGLKLDVFSLAVNSQVALAIKKPPRKLILSGLFNAGVAHESGQDGQGAD